MMSVKRVRCAIYTRVSTDAGLDQEFNSLDAQFEASQAYIRSQVHDGWALVRDRYDDGGYSGGSTERPALQQLLADIRARKIDVIVVYKVDRLTRSLADFAKLVELFDGHGVSFVSVTQQFNTTTSMGRLTLNVLLSFAQFEREVTSERIRDKIAASKRKGLWVGGMVPLGYESRDKKLVVHEDEAECVRTIFQRYLELGSIGKLLPDLCRRGIRTKVRSLSTGRIIGGIPFTRGPLAYLLRNRFYIGEVMFKGQVYPGEQPAILGRELFEAVQRQLTEQHNGYRTARASSGSLLLGLIFDDHGNRMSPSHCQKRGTRYRYYVSIALSQGKPDRVGTVTRVPAAKIEDVVADALRAHLGRHRAMDTSAPITELISTYVDRIVVAPTEIVITLRGDLGSIDAADDSNRTEEDVTSNARILTVPWSKTSSRRHHDILVPHDAEGSEVRPIRSETRAKLVISIARARLWLAELESGTSSIETLALREGCSRRHVNMTISLAFLSPKLVKDAIDGRLPQGIGVARLFDPPLAWSRQHQMLGLTP